MPGENTEVSSGGSADGFDMEAAVGEVASGLGFDETDDHVGSQDDPAPAEDDGQESTPGAEEAPEPAPAPESPKPSTPPPQPPGPADLTQPPKTWRKEATAGWETLPESVRAEIHKRENDMYVGLEQYRTSAQLGNDVSSLFQPYQQVMQSAGVTPQQILPGLVSAHGTLALGSDDAKVNMLDNLIRDYNIPLPKLLAKLTGGAVSDIEPYVDPTVKSLREQVEALNSRLSAQDQQAMQAKQAEIREEVSKFANDPANIYFDELADDIAALMRGGVVRDLKSAYEKAMWANPVVRAKEQARIAAQAESERIRKAQEAAKKAKATAAANVRSHARSGGPTAAATDSIDETLEQTLAAINARSN